MGFKELDLSAKIYGLAIIFLIALLLVEATIYYGFIWAFGAWPLVSWIFLILVLASLFLLYNKKTWAWIIVGVTHLASILFYGYLEKFYYGIKYYMYKIHLITTNGPFFYYLYVLILSILVFSLKLKEKYSRKIDKILGYLMVFFGAMMISRIADQRLGFEFDLTATIVATIYAIVSLILIFKQSSKPPSSLKV